MCVRQVRGERTWAIHGSAWLKQKRWGGGVEEQEKLTRPPEGMGT